MPTWATKKKIDHLEQNELKFQEFSHYVVSLLSIECGESALEYWGV